MIFFTPDIQSFAILTLNGIIIAYDLPANSYVGYVLKKHLFLRNHPRTSIELSKITDIQKDANFIRIHTDIEEFHLHIQDEKEQDKLMKFWKNKYKKRS